MEIRKWIQPLFSPKKLRTTYVETGRITLTHAAKNAAASRDLGFGFAAVQGAGALGDFPFCALVVLDLLDICWWRDPYATDLTNGLVRWVGRCNGLKRVAG